MIINLFKGDVKLYVVETSLSVEKKSMIFIIVVYKKHFHLHP